MDKLNKVAQISLLFWLMKIVATTLGETLGDFLTKPIAKGGLNLGSLNASIVSIAIMLIMITIAHQSIKKQINA